MGGNRALYIHGTVVMPDSLRREAKSIDEGIWRFASKYRSMNQLMWKYSRGQRAEQRSYEYWA